MGVKERDPWRIEPDLPPPAPEHHVDGLGEKLSGVLTEFLVRAPAQFLVENVLAPLYARRRDRGAGRHHRLSEGTVDESDCDGRGMYLDVETDACVYICREGYVWDATTRSCKLIVTNPTSRAAAVDAHVPSVGRKPGMGKNVRKIEAPSALPAKLEKRFYGTRDESPLDGAVRWLVNRMVGGGSDTEKCAVGFFYDAKGKKCTPICRPGYVLRPGDQAMRLGRYQRQDDTVMDRKSHHSRVCTSKTIRYDVRLRYDEDYGTLFLLER